MEEIDMDMLRDKILSYQFKTMEKKSNYTFEEAVKPEEKKESKVVIIKKLFKELSSTNCCLCDSNYECDKLKQQLIFEIDSYFLIGINSNLCENSKIYSKQKNMILNECNDVQDVF